MGNTVYADATLLLVGHGSAQNAESGRTVYQHALDLRRRRIFADVREGFLKQEPLVVRELANLPTPRVIIVPLFISEGYFTEQVLPRELGLSTEGQSSYERVQFHAGRQLYYCKPVGTHPAMTNVLLARARDTVQRHPFPTAPPPAETALIIAGHGTPKDPNSRQAVDCQVELIREMNRYAEVHAVFIEEPPRIADCYDLAQAGNLVVVPFFISAGRHTLEDIPVLLGEPEASVRERLEQGLFPWRNPTARNGKRVWYTASIGSEPLIAEVILERVKETVGAVG